MSQSTITVKKRKGYVEPLDLDKLHKMVETACEGLSGVSASQVEMSSGLQFYNGIDTADIQEILIKSASDLISLEAPNYQYVAARLLLFAIRKSLYGGKIDLPHLYDHFQTVNQIGFYDSTILTFYTKEEFDEANSYIDHSRDFMFTYAGLREIVDKYLVQDRSTKKVYETPQFMYMLVSMVTFSRYPKETRMSYVKRYYDAISKHKINIPTPVNAGVRTNKRQYASCTLLDCGDSLKSIEATLSALIRYVSAKSGIGLNVGRIRGLGSKIRNGEVIHTGIVPFIKSFEGVLNSCCVTPDTWVEILQPSQDLNTKIAKTKKIKIKDLQIGAKIKTKDENGNIVFKRVTDKFNTIVHSENQLLLRFTNGSKLNCSTNHPILILGDGGEFIEKLPMDISNSDKIITESGVTNLLFIDNYQQNDINYIDITVEDCHTFFASDAEFEEMILTHNSQGGLRKGSATLFFPIWHQEVEELIVLKNEKGNDENRARSLDYAVSISKIFYERFIKDENITLFSPHDVPGLYDAFGTDSFDDLYIHYEQDKSIPRKTVGAQKLIFDILNERSDTGRIYILNIDHTNSHGPYSKTVRMSNLCLEICLLTEPIEHIDDTNGLIALCVLSALNVGVIKSEKEFEDCCELSVRALDELIDIQEYPVKAAEIATRKYRPLGIGFIGVAHYLAKLGLNYEDKEAWDVMHKLAESHQYYLLKASNQLAKEKGVCEGFCDTKYSQGILPIDTYKKDVDDFCDNTLQHDWESLRKDIVTYGLRNTTTSAQMPSETSSKTSNATNGIEPPRGFLSVKRKIKQIVPQYTTLKNKYTLLWDMKSNEGYFNIVAVMQKFFDQSISANWSYNPEHYPDNKVPMSVVVNDFLQAYKKGHKTAYYMNTYDGKKDDMNIDDLVKEILDEGDANCDSCTI